MITYAIGGDVMKGLRIALLILLALAMTACGRAVPRLEGDVMRSGPWSKELVAQMSEVPVQDNGRQKPLSVLASFRLYKIHGRRDLKYSVVDAAGNESKYTLTPMEWLLDVICYPDQAASYPLFRIENSSVLDALKIANDGQTPDFVYISYDTVRSKYETLRGLAQEYAPIEPADRTPIQAHVFGLWQRFIAYDNLQRQFAAFRYTMPVAEEELQSAFGTENVGVGAIAQSAAKFNALLKKLDPEATNASQGLINIADFVGKVITNDDDGVGIIGWADDSEEEWLTFGEGFERILTGEEEGSLADVFTSLERAVRPNSLADKEAALLLFRDASITAAGQQYNSVQVEREIEYYNSSWHYQSIHYFLLAFLMATVTWLLPRNKILWWGSLSVCGVAIGMLTFDLILRILITGHPPIKNLYDTFLFIAWVSALLLLCTEFVMPRRICLAAAPFVGALLVMFARTYEVNNASDTMDPLVAVLDSNFWLATHVTTINIGYAAGLAAAVLAYVWIFMRIFRIGHPSDVRAKALIRMCYGVTCFGLLFSVVGTILGGVWANDSWGRFWGWDPKENGALMICLGQIALLHARFTGWIRDVGFVIWAGIVGIVVVFSWFHVNLLQVGLHAYGFDSGLRDAVWMTYSVQGGVLIAGVLDVVLRPNPVRAKASVSSASPATSS